MSTALLKRLRRLSGDDRAATAVEFALLAPPLIFLILASLQLSIIFFAGQYLQSMATASAREIMTGQVQAAAAAASDTSTQAQTTFQTDVCNIPNLPPLFFTCGNIMVDVESTSTYSALSPLTAPITPILNSSGKATNLTYSPGGPGDIVILRLMYNWPVVAGPLLPGLANQSNGDRLLVATSVLKIEPY
jgi:Flp pilus assembly protein TadG